VKAVAFVVGAVAAAAIVSPAQAVTGQEFLRPCDALERGALVSGDTVRLPKARMLRHQVRPRASSRPRSPGHSPHHPGPEPIFSLSHARSNRSRAAQGGLVERACPKSAILILADALVPSSKVRRSRDRSGSVQASAFRRVPCLRSSGVCS
jgi:hypothetical protein